METSHRPTRRTSLLAVLAVLAAALNSVTLGATAADASVISTSDSHNFAAPPPMCPLTVDGDRSHANIPVASPPGCLWDEAGNAGGSAAVTQIDVAAGTATIQITPALGTLHTCSNCSPQDLRNNPPGWDVDHYTPLVGAKLSFGGTGKSLTQGGQLQQWYPGDPLREGNAGITGISVQNGDGSWSPMGGSVDCTAGCTLRLQGLGNGGAFDTGLPFWLRATMVQNTDAYSDIGYVQEWSEFLISVGAVGVGPHAEFGSQVSTTRAEFDASESTPADSITSYAWDFGDDTDPVTTTDATTSHDYAKAGTYHVTLTVTDNAGRTASVTHDVATAPGDLVVNSTGDAEDTDTTDGICDTGNKVGDAPECTLRAAIQEANARSGADSITFAVPGGGTPRITPTTDLPDLADSVTIDGTSQASHWVEIDANGATYGLRLKSGTSTIRGIAIWGASNAAIAAVGGTGHRIVGDHIGTDAAGTADHSEHNGIGVSGSTGVVIGDTGSGDGNVIVGGTVNSSNLSGSAVVIGIGSAGVQIIGNRINENASGTAPLGPPEGTGSAVRVQSPQAVIKGNQIGRGSRGVWLDAGSQGALVDGNTIGVGADGSAPMPVTDGIRVEGTPQATITHNTVVATRIDLAVAGRQSYDGGSDGGVGLRTPSTTDSSGAVTGTGTQISGNTLGYQGTGAGPDGDRTAGLYLWDGASDVIVSDNTIAGHRTSEVVVAGGSGAVLTDNRIDVLADGHTRPGTVATDGIRSFGATALTIGLPDHPNVIGYAKNGIYLASQDEQHPSTGVTIQSNDLGVAVDGTTNLGMDTGIVLAAAAGTTIGGGNQILNNQTGIDLLYKGVTGTVITGNTIGRSALDTSGPKTVGIITSDVPDVRIGPGNKIGGVNGAAIDTSAATASIGQNAIGLTTIHGQAWPNAGPGVFVEAGHADILGDEIAHNGNGVVTKGAATAYVSDTSIHDNGGPGIEPTHAPAAPQLAVVQAPGTGTPRTWLALTGLAANAPVKVEVFANPSCLEGTQGQTPLIQKAAATSSSGGVVATLLGKDYKTADHFTVTVTDLAGGGSTSPFSACVDRDANPVDTDGDGIPDAVERALVPGSENTALTTVVPGDGDRDFTQLAVTEGTLANVTPADQAEGAPSGLAFPGGLVSFEIRGLEAGATAQVLIRGPVSATQYWRYGPPTLGAAPSWYEWEYDANRGTGARLKTPGIWELYLRDGAPGDDDGAMNGVIRDPGGLASVAPVDTPGGSGDSGGGAAASTTSAAPGSGSTAGSAPGTGSAGGGSHGSAPGAADANPTVEVAGLANTGAPVAPVALLALELLCCGLALIRLGRRRPSRH